MIATFKSLRTISTHWHWFLNLPLLCKNQCFEVSSQMYIYQTFSITQELKLHQILCAWFRWGWSKNKLKMTHSKTEIFKNVSILDSLTAIYVGPLPLLWLLHQFIHFDKSNDKIVAYEQLNNFIFSAKQSIL